ncbi:MAG: hypothetical protein IJT56_10175 [Clostridia bacterium]|nr:hypothetical protein [Clostridia bacterium]
MTGNETLQGYTPPKRKAPAVIMSGLCLAIAAACLILSGLGIGWRALLQLAAMAAAVAAIEITTRFILTEYTYTVVFGPDGADFTVSKTNGKKIKTVANIAMTTVKALTAHEGISALEKSHGHISRSFIYTANVFPIKKGQLKSSPETETKKYALVFEFNGDTDAIVIECSKDFADYINDILKTPADIGNDAGSEAR